MREEGSSFINDINHICENKLQINYDAIKIKNNIFIQQFNSSEIFKYHTIQKIENLYKTYKDSDNEKPLLDDIASLLYSNWDGMYSELTAYHCLNLCLQEPCEIQIINPQLKTLASYCKKAKVSAVDGFSQDLVSYFEIKSLNPHYNELLCKLKNELQSFEENNYFTFEVHALAEINDYTSLKKEIEDAKNSKIKYLSSKTNKGVNFRFFYNKKSVIIDMKQECTPYELASKLEYLPLKSYKQFVEKNFIKIFVSTNLNINRETINDSEFFRALARRVFVKLTKENETFDNNSDLSTSEIAKTIGGLIFIVDKSNTDEITLNSKPQDLYNMYVYSNPNAKKQCSFLGYRNFTYCNKMIKKIDDFTYDNY